jgi:hypothetical protein
MGIQRNRARIGELGRVLESRQFKVMEEEMTKENFIVI